MSPHSQLKIAEVVSAPFEENSYILWAEGSPDCFIIDPGFDPESIFDEISRRRLSPLAILLTHGHADHICGVPAMKEQWPNCPVIIGEGDAYKLGDPVANLSEPFGMPIRISPADRTVTEGERLGSGNLECLVRETPGHSAGHVVFIFDHVSPNVVAGGDVLFAGGIGRYDFPDGSFSDLASSIRNKLYTLNDDTIVLPGHGPDTTIGEEKRTNPYVREV